jgi:hypothetical protein
VHPLILFPTTSKTHSTSGRTTADGEFVYYVIADNPIGDSCYYPDSGKWAVRKEGAQTVIIKGEETHYLDGEE